MDIPIRESQIIYNEDSKNTKKEKNKSCFTYKRRPVQLVFNQEFNDVEQVIYFEKKIKKWSAKKKLALADENFDLLQLLAECRNKTHANNKRND
ncbi:GIY-YIG nuclease family protein [Aquimarina sp. W85]|uniref:GIY-YIG nuclease family protein n=1 Tax=Aquimarina rhodophyticola TaxID=3342246 RepID=UPI00366D89B8